MKQHICYNQYIYIFIYLVYWQVLVQSCFKSFDQCYVFLNKIKTREKKTKGEFLFEFLFILKNFLLCFIIKLATGFSKSVIAESYYWLFRFSSIKDLLDYRNKIHNGIIAINLCSSFLFIENKKIFKNGISTSLWGNCY